jgi:hypothetical protein
MGTTISGYLTTLFAGITSGAGESGIASLFNTIYGIGTSANNALGQNPVTALASAEQNQTKDVALTAAQPQVQRAITAFTTAVQSATSVKQLLSNPMVMQVLLTANGLAAQIPYTALAQKALESDLTDPKSLANTLPDTSWKTTAALYNFASQGLAVIQQPKVLAAITNGYAENTWLTSLDATTPGLANALTFRNTASTITSVDQVLGDPVMRSVVTTTLGIPLQIAFQPLEAQETAITSRIDLTKFKDPKFVDTFLQRYMIASAAAAAAAAATSSVSALPSLATLAVKAQGLTV